MVYRSRKVYLKSYFIELLRLFLLLGLLRKHGHDGDGSLTAVFGSLTAVFGSLTAVFGSLTAVFGSRTAIRG
jgi:hypothetical protein